MKSFRERYELAIIATPVITMIASLLIAFMLKDLHLGSDKLSSGFMLLAGVAFLTTCVQIAFGSK